MAGSFITVDARQLPRLEWLLSGLEDKGRDPSELMDRIGMFEEAETIERFNLEEAPDGSAWKPSLRAQTQSGKTMTESARLKQSITHQAGRFEVEIGTNVIYAGVHQHGAVIRPTSGKALAFKLPGGLGFVTVAQVTIPARPFLGLSSASGTEIPLLAEDWLAEGLA